MKHTGILGLAALLLVSGWGARADAGDTGEANGIVTILRTSSPNAYGAFGTTRNSSEYMDYIDCTLFASATGNSVACYALTPTDYLFCSSTDSATVAAVRGLSADSFVAFTTDGSGHCTNINAVNSSNYSPKH